MFVARSWQTPERGHFAIAPADVNAHISERPRGHLAPETDELLTSHARNGLVSLLAERRTCRDARVEGAAARDTECHVHAIAEARSIGPRRFDVSDGRSPVFTQRLSRRMPRPWWPHASQYDMRSIRKASGLMDVGRSAVGSKQISWSSSFPLA